MYRSIRTSLGAPVADVGNRVRTADVGMMKRRVQ
jgi:hypothetical protein